MDRPGGFPADRHRRKISHPAPALAPAGSLAAPSAGGLPCCFRTWGAARCGSAAALHVQHSGYVGCRNRAGRTCPRGHYGGHWRPDLPGATTPVLAAPRCRAWSLDSRLRTCAPPSPLRVTLPRGIAPGRTRMQREGAVLRHWATRASPVILQSTASNQQPAASRQQPVIGSLGAAWCSFQRMPPRGLPLPVPPPLPLPWKPLCIANCLSERTEWWSWFGVLAKVATKFSFFIMLLGRSGLSSRIGVFPSRILGAGSFSPLRRQQDPFLLWWGGAFALHRTGLQGGIGPLQR